MQAVAHIEAEMSPATPRRLDTYAVVYAIGVVWLSVTAVMLGSQAQFSFTPFYDFLLAMPPFATAFTFLLVDRRGRWSTFPLRVLLMTVVGGVVSACSTVILAPLLALMFREGITGDLGRTGLIASIVLVAVASPLIYGVIQSFRTQSYGRLGALLVGIGVTLISLAMTLDPSGPLATSMRLDQARIMMVVSTWWLPFYAVSAAFLRDAELI